MNNHSHTKAIDFVLGAVAGGVATVALDGVTSGLYEHEDGTARRREDRARGGLSAYEVAADRLAGLAHVHLDDSRRSTAGDGIHYSLGIGTGSLYGAVRRFLPLAPPLRGLAFGAAFWLIADEAAVPALGLTPGPRAFPWQTHVRGLAAHLAFGLVAETVLGVADLVRARLEG